MRKFRVRTDRQATLVGDQGRQPLALPELFGRRAPVRLEIGIGHGEFIAQMAALHPDEDFLGVEQNELRVNKTAHKSLQAAAGNVRLFTDEAHRFVHFRVPPRSVHRVYSLFPDPWPKFSHRRRRLMNRAFLLDISRVMAPGGRLVIASDTHDYAFQALSNLTTLPGLWRNLYAPHGYRFDIPTRFPTVFERHKKEEGCRIAYLACERSDEPAPASAPWAERRSDDAKH